MKDYVEVCLESDDDGHDYLIPATRKEEFDRLLEQGEDDYYEAFSAAFNDYAVGGALTVKLYAEKGYEATL